MILQRSYIALLVFFVMEIPTCWSQTLVSDSIMEQYNVVVMNDSSQIAAFGNIKNNIPHGEWIYLNRRGGVMSQGSFKKGLKHGKWKFYDVFGDLLTTGRYKNGKLHGKWVFHYLNNECETIYKNNFKYKSTCLEE